MSFFKKSKNENEENIGNNTQPMTDADQLKKIADHLIFLEKKIDQLLDASRSPRKPFGQRFGGTGTGNGDFQRPRNNFRSNSYGGSRPAGAGRPYGQGRPSGGRPEGGRPYEGNRSEGQGRPSGGRPYEGNRPEGGRPYEGNRPHSPRQHRPS